MKKVVNVITVLFTVLLAFVSCSLNSEVEELVSATLTTSDNARALIAEVDFDVSKVAEWKYTATKADNGLKTGQTTTEEVLQSGKTQLLSQGSWNFTLSGYDTDGKIVCSGSIENAVVTTKSYTVKITVKPSQNGGKGKIIVEDDISIKGKDGTVYSAGSGTNEYTKTVTVKNKTTSTVLTGESGTYDDVDSGIYEVTITFTGTVEGTTTTYQAAKATKVVNVYDNLTTVVSGTIEETAKAASISTEGEVVAEATKTITFEENKSTTAATYSVASTAVGSSKKTTVSFPAGALTNSTTTSGEVKLTVQSSAIESASETYAIETSEGSVVAGFDFNLTGADSTFSEGVTISTYIEPGLDESKLSIKYVGDDVTETEATKPVIDSYTSSTGLLKFTVHHFSKYVLTSSETVVYDYTTLFNALQKSAPGGDIIVVKDISYPTFIKIYSTKGKEYNINLNGHTISSSTAAPFQIQSGTVTFSGKGTIITTAEDGNALDINPNPGVLSNAKLVGDPVVTIGPDVTLKGGDFGIFIDGITATKRNSYGVNGAVINMNGKIESNNGIYINGTIQFTNEFAPTINLEGAVINTTYSGIYAGGYANWNLKDTTITAGTPFSMKTGIVTIDGGSYTATGAFVESPADNGNGGVLTGAALSMTSNDSYTSKTLNVTVKDGTFTSANSYAVYEGIPNGTTTGTAVAEASYVILDIQGGTFTGNATKAAVSLTAMTDKNVIKGGTFNSDPTSMLATGYTATKDESTSTWTVVETPAE